MFNFLKNKVLDRTKRKTTDIKVSVIMPVYLGNYEGAADNRVERFKSAVVTFAVQSYKNCELIIISDGCDIAESIYKDCLVYDNIIFKKIKKQPLFSGNVRAEGMKLATGDIICYLDSDDMIGCNHLQTIVSGFSLIDVDYVYYNDVIRVNNQEPIKRSVRLEHGSVGTSTIAHRNDLDCSWVCCNGYGHDWTFINQMLTKYIGKKIYGAEYLVCHIKH